jgi:phosphohistidine swiveling domain-containing protein
VGTWTGTATVQGSPGQTMQLAQTHEASFQQDGSILVVQATGRETKTGKAMFETLAIVSSDYGTATYSVRLYTSGRKLDAPFTLEGNGYSWTFQLGPATVRDTMRITPKGEWLQTSTMKIGVQPETISARFLLRKVK